MDNVLGTLPLSGDIFSKAKIGLWAFELDDGAPPRMYVDDTMLGLIGLDHHVSPEEAYHAWYDNIDKRAYALVSAAVENMTSGDHAEVQYPWHHPDGRTMIVRCGGVRNFNYTKGVRIEGTHQNVTEMIHFQEEKEAEHAVIFRFILNSYESLYYVGLDDQLWQIYKRPQYLEKDYPQNENYLDAMKRYIATEVHPDDRELSSILVQPEELKRRLAVYPGFSFIFRKTSENQEKYLLCEVVRGADDSHVLLGYKNVTDEERKNKELALSVDLATQQRIIKSFGDMVNAALWNIDIDENDKITDVRWSDEFRKMFGFKESAEDFPNTIDAWSSRLHPDDKERTLEHFYNGIKSRDTKSFVYDIEYRILRKNGKYHWYRAVGRMENIDTGGRRMYGIIYDITADKLLEEKQKQLEEALAMAQAANLAKTTFLNNMSHDIRTPMNAIIGYTGLAASHINSKDLVQEYLNKIGQSSDHLLSLINDILDMSRIESGKMNISENEENLSDILHTLRDIVQADIHSKQLDFFVDAVDVNDEDIICDKLRLNQVLLNILSNSIKYTAAGGTVAMRVTEKTIKPNGYATYEFCVKDNGMGMTKEFLGTIFDPFTRVNSSTVSGIQGTGLGMAITKNIIDMMGGSIDIKSEPAKGTEVTIIFDFKLQSAPKIPEEIPEFRGARSLVADDDSSTCLSICNMLEDIGIRSEWCTSGKEAVIRAEAAHKKGDSFKVYIIDWIMPDMNGIETVRRIRKVIGDEVPIIILTAYDWSDIESEAREAGVTAFVSKPMFPSDLSRVLGGCVGKGKEEVPSEPVTYNFAGKKILLVEDNYINREIATELLNECGFIIDTAEDGYIAVEKIRTAHEGDYDLILMDVQMPTMDGYEATRNIRALGTAISKIPILAMTANAFEEDRKSALDAGMNEHIAKPINIEKLKDTLAQFL